MNLVKNHDLICIEDLAVKEMIKNFILSKQIQDASWGTFIRLLEYKCDWYGKDLIKIDRFFPSSKTCHVCGYQKQDLKLSDREWECVECNTKHDRDHNASINILMQGKNKLKESVLGNNSDLKQKQVESLSQDKAMKLEIDNNYIS